MDIDDPDVPVYVPWYRKAKDIQPYSLSTLLTSQKDQLHCTACFPWTTNSLDSLWGGNAVHNPRLATRWSEVVKKWTGAIAVGATGRLLIFPKLATAKSFAVSLSESEANVKIDNVAWAINTNHPLEPLIVFTVTSVVMIFDINSLSLVGKLRGHGGPITSLCVHPTQPHLFATTSRDFTTRIYDLALYPVQVPNNPHWLPRTEPSLAGPAHGLHMCEPEGEGIGQCVAVMVGGRSGGHKGGVVCAAFHPSQPLIATGGIDRAVKIWRIPPAVYSPPAQPRLAREDKPLFSSDLLHKARVLSVAWLADDIILSHSAPALMRRNQDVPDDMYYEDGTVAVWQWLGYNRFFPPGKVPQKVMRGTASDYRNSESFKVLSAYHLPAPTGTVAYCHVYQSLVHTPILLIPMGKLIRAFNISQFKPRTPPKYPADDLTYLASQFRLEGEKERHEDTGTHSAGRSWEGSAVQDDVDESSREASLEKEQDNLQTSMPATTTYPPPAPLAVLFEAVEGWDIKAVVKSGGPTDVPEVTACEVGFQGRVIVGVGGGTLSIWRLQE
ncbi:WD40-repeat-containing domain protein [Trametes gibbosa]|nr:WD40-repeat-containing domain protein [Trametes gibbosa]